VRVGGGESTSWDVRAGGSSDHPNSLVEGTLGEEKVLEKLVRERE